MSKHTPGPWNVCQPVEWDLGGRSWTAEQMMHMWWVGKRPGVAVALIDGSEAQSGESNARLISAAPELLNELQGLVNAVDEYIEAAIRDGEPVYLAIPESARAAIAKARGSS
jgi:hypothetical protein